MTTPQVKVISARRCKVNPAYYQRMFPNASVIYVSDMAPNEKFQPLKDIGWKEISGVPAEIAQNGQKACDEYVKSRNASFTGEVFYRNASVGGSRRIYVQA